MRVISGTAKGRRLKGPPGPGTRPMADKVKEATFSMLASLGVEPDRVLDLYAGTGSIGIEALSRGGAWADFVDESAAACAVVRFNLAQTGFANVSRVHTLPVLRFISRGGQPYDFIILDPPYAAPDILDVVTKLAESSLVQSGTIVVLGHSPRVRLPDQIGRLERLRERCHGDSCVSIFEADEPRASEPESLDGGGPAGGLSA